MHFPANLDPDNARLLSTQLTHAVWPTDSFVRAQERKELTSKQPPPLSQQRETRLTQECGFFALSRTSAAQWGLGIVIEYANQGHEPQWSAPPCSVRDYARFEEHRQVTLPDHRINLAVEKVSGGRGGITSGPLTVSPGQKPIRNSPASSESSRM
jgi:hypothetical protein